MPVPADTLHAQVTHAAARLVAHGIPEREARLDARLLAQQVLGWDAAQFLTRAIEVAPPEFAGRYDAVISRRARREPLAYIVGRQEFWGLSFEVTPAVLIPRPETELIVDIALEQLADVASPRIADVCTGSGCLAIALARERPTATLVATEISTPAVRVARRNAARHHVLDRLHLVRTDLLSGIGGVFDAVISNPPYVADADAPMLPPEVGAYEPALALFGGPAGLDVIARLLTAAAGRLRRGGLLVVEIGADQGDAVAGLLDRTAGLRMMELRRDLQALPRAAVARRL